MDGQIWFYIAAAVIYFLTRKKKKPEKPGSSQPNQQNPNQSETKKPVSFEDLLKEITEQRGEPTKAESSQEPIPEEPVSVRDEPRFKQEGQTREFADDESREIYQESIRRAKEIDIPYEPDEHYKSRRLFKGDKEEEEESTIADEIREGLSSSDSAKKAIIYSEILNRRY